MSAIVGCESGYKVAVQSQHRYTPKNVPRGYNVGDREESWGLVQIHLPAHPTVTKEQAIDPEFAIDWLAQGIAEGKANQWTCYTEHIALKHY